MEIPPGQKQFNCEHCQAAILVPVDLPPTSAPCPVCQQITTSPGPEAAPSPTPPEPTDREQVRPEPVEQAPAYQEKAGGGGAGILWGLAVLTFVGLLAGGYYLFQEHRVKSGEGVVNPLDAPTTRTAARPTFDGVEKEALTLLEGFLDAKTPEEKARFVINGEEALPEMKAYYGGGGIEKDNIRADYFSEWAMDTTDTDRGIFLLEYDRPKQFKMSELFSPVTDIKTHLTLEEPDLQTKSLAMRENFEMEAERARIFLKQKDGKLLLDWHTYVQTKDRTFRDFINFPVAGRKKVFRLFIAEEVGTILRGDPALREYRLVDPAHSREDVAKVFVERKTEVGKILEELAWTDVIGKAPHGKSITLELEWSNEPEPKLKIPRIICWEFLGVGGDPSNLASSN